MSLAARHVPVRSCVGCNERDAQPCLARFTLFEGRPVWDLEGRRRGRGAYLHLERRCLDAFLSRKPFLRSLRASVPAPERVRLVAERPLR
ncbi:MAG: DUF448 domain-containing protein [Deltaproteobacteria bacterium]|nr:DUF448 domain-containing protein [Deltaproteobacteria bacterium]